jgi:hypothetical protein
VAERCQGTACGVIGEPCCSEQGAGCFGDTVDCVENRCVQGN